MKLKLIDRIIQATLIAAVICFIGGSLMHYFWEGLALFAGAVWGSINLFFLKLLLHNLLLQKNKSLKLLILLSIKWPLLYLAGFGLLKNGYLGSLHLLIGFSILFVMIVFIGLAEVKKSHEK